MNKPQTDQTSVKHPSKGQQQQTDPMPVKHPSKGQQLLNNLALITLGLAFAAIGLIIYWASTGTRALEVSNAPVPVQPAFVKSLDQVTVSVDFCKYTNASGRVIRKLVSAKTALLAPPAVESLPEGCYNNLEVKVPIPDQTPPGTYKLVYRVTYQTNPLHEIVVEFESQTFEVKP